MAFISPKKENPVPGEGSEPVSSQGSVEGLGRGTARQSDAEAAARRNCLLGSSSEFVGRAGEKGFGRFEDTNFRTGTDGFLYAGTRLTEAQRAAPNRASFSLVIIRTGMLSISGFMRPFSMKDFMNSGPFNLGRIFGAMPPAT